MKQAGMGMETYVNNSDEGITGLDLNWMNYPR